MHFERYPLSQSIQFDRKTFLAVLVDSESSLQNADLLWKTCKVIACAFGLLSQITKQPLADLVVAHPTVYMEHKIVMISLLIETPLVVQKIGLAN